MYPWRIETPAAAKAWFYNSTKRRLEGKNNIVLIDTLNPEAQSLSEKFKDDSLLLYSTPAYPYVPYNLETSGTSYTFANGGMVICTSPMTVTLFAGEPRSLTFSNFAGVLPVGIGTKVTTSATAYFAGY